MGSPNEISSVAPDILEPVMLEVQPLLLQILVVFDGPTFISGQGDNQYITQTYESKLDYSSLMTDLKEVSNHNGMVISKIIHVEETSSRCIDIASMKIKQEVDGLCLQSISKIDLSIYVPTSSPRSCNLQLLVNKFDYNNNITSDVVNEIVDEKIRFTSTKVNKIEIHEIQLNVNDDNDDSQDYPTDLDAKIAAVLCEYTYYICRLLENLKIEKPNGLIGNLSATVEKTIKPPFFIVQWLRESSINSRATATTDEILNLKIIPERWKKIRQFEGNIQHQIPENSVELADFDEYQKKIELDKWDAIKLDGKGWLGMCNHSISWENSLALKIIKGIEHDSDKRFSFIGNKGVLNKWGIFCKNSGLSSVIYVNEEKLEVMYCVAGSDFGKDLFFNGDWTTTNFLQFFVGMSPQYQQSVTNALILDRVISEIEKELNSKIKLTFIGHSLGGGLASNNAIVTKNRHAITFNAAGLNWLRVNVSLFLHNKKELSNPFKGSNRVHLFVIKGEILDMAQSVAETFCFTVNQNTIKPHLRAYSSPITRKDIPAPDSATGTLGRHSMTNFMNPPEYLEKLKI